MNPTTDVVEQRLAASRAASAALLVASGQAAETLALLNLAEAGDHIVASPSLYGGTYNLLHYTFPKLGIEVTFVDDPDDLESWRAAVRPNTKAFFAETISNPKQDVLDIEGVAGVAHEVGVPLIVDNTVATPYLIRPLEWGADIVVHSATKYLGGHGTAIGGVIVDGGTLRLRRGPGAVPAASTSPTRATTAWSTRRDLGVGSALGANLAFILKARVQLLRDLGPAASPFNAFLLAQGIETLSLRIERHVQQRRSGSPSGSRAATRWRPSPTPGLPSSPWHDAGAEVRAAGRRAPCWPSRSTAGSRPASASSTPSSCTATWPTSATCASWSSTRPRPRTASSPRQEQLTTGVTPGPGPAGGRPRAHRRHPGRPRGRVPGRQGGLMPALADPATRRVTAGSATLGLAAPWTSVVRRCEAGAALPDVRLAYETWGDADAGAGQRRAGAARPHRRQPRRRRRRSGASHAGLVGRPDRAGAAARHRPLVRRRAQRPRRLPGHHRSGVGRPRTGGRGGRASRS